MGRLFRKDEEDERRRNDRSLSKQTNRTRLRFVRCIVMNTQSVFEHASRANDNSPMTIVFLVWLLHVLRDNERLAGVNAAG